MASTEEQIPDIEKAVLEEVQEVTGLVPADMGAMDLPPCETHTFVFLRTAKVKYQLKGEDKQPGGPTHTFHRTDTFFCQHCLRYTMMDREERSSTNPMWYRDGVR